MIAGANKDDYHLRNVTPGEDFTAEYHDLRQVARATPARMRRAAEHRQDRRNRPIFKLGYKYSDSMGLRVLERDGKEVTPIMGSYGIGIERILCSAVELYHDENGISLPPTIAPFEVVVTPVNIDDAASARPPKQLYAELPSGRHRRPPRRPRRAARRQVQGRRPDRHPLPHHRRQEARRRAKWKSWSAARKTTAEVPVAEVVRVIAARSERCLRNALTGPGPRDFPALERLDLSEHCHLRAASPRTVEAIAAPPRSPRRTACRDFLSWFDDADLLRAKLARLMHCRGRRHRLHAQRLHRASAPDRPARLAAGDEILTLEDEFPNHIYAPPAARHGVSSRSARERLLDSSRPARAWWLSAPSTTPPGSARPRSARAPAARRECSSTSTARRCSAHCRSISPPSSPTCCAVNCYKWMLAPNGTHSGRPPRTARTACPRTCRLAQSPRLAQRRKSPPRHTGAHRNAEKYEGGMLASPLLYAMEASVGMILEIGPAAIEQRVMELAGCLRERLRVLGARLPCDESPHYRSPIVAARFGKPASDLAKQLKTRGVLVSARHDNLRVSTHFYNSEEDIERLAEELKPLL